MCILDWAFNRFIVIYCFAYIMGCGTGNIAEPYTTLTTEERAKQELDRENFVEAAALFEEAIAKDPDDYELYRFLAASYAGLGGFDILDLISGSEGNAGDGGQGSATSLFDKIGSFLPNDPSIEQIEAIESARNTMLSIPEEFRNANNTEVANAKSAALQLSIYQSAFALIYMNRFTEIAANGVLNQEKLASMTDEDVETILTNLSSVANSNGDPKIASDVQKTLDKIDQQEGGTQKEKLISYLNEKNRPRTSLL